MVGSGYGNYPLAVMAMALTVAATQLALPAAPATAGFFGVMGSALWYVTTVSTSLTVVEKVPEVVDEVANSVKKGVAVTGDGVSSIIRCVMLGALILIAMVIVKVLRWVWSHGPRSACAITSRMRLTKKPGMPLLLPDTEEG